MTTKYRNGGIVVPGNWAGDSLPCRFPSALIFLYSFDFAYCCSKQELVRVFAFQPLLTPCPPQSPLFPAPSLSFSQSFIQAGLRGPGFRSLKHFQVKNDYLECGMPKIHPWCNGLLSLGERKKKKEKKKKLCQSRPPSKRGKARKRKLPQKWPWKIQLSRKLQIIEWLIPK